MQARRHSEAGNCSLLAAARPISSGALSSAVLRLRIQTASGTGKCSSYNMNDIAQNDTLFVSGHFDSEGTSSYDVTKVLKSMTYNMTSLLS